MADKKPKKESGKDLVKADKDKEEDDGILLICLPVMPKERPYVPGAVVRECADCGRPIWVAPSGQKMEREQGAEVACFECAEKRMKEDPESKLQPPTPEQIEEIKRTLLWNEARKFRGKTETV